MDRGNWAKPLATGAAIAALGVGAVALAGETPASRAVSTSAPAAAVGVGYVATTTELREPRPSAQPNPDERQATNASHSSPHADYTKNVWTVGSQPQIDQCRGLVQVKFSGNRSVVAQHNYCGGEWILNLAKGQVVTLTGTVSGTYRATVAKVVTRGAGVDVLNGMSRVGIVLQTCYFNSDKMRLVGLERIT